MSQPKVVTFPNQQMHHVCIFLRVLEDGVQAQSRGQASGSGIVLPGLDPGSVAGELWDLGEVLSLRFLRSHGISVQIK